MKIVIAFYGFYEHVSDNQAGRHDISTWKLAWPFFEKNVYGPNSHHTIQTVFHTWEEPTKEVVDTLKPTIFVVEKQTAYDDGLINEQAKHSKGYKSYNYNNLKNRLRSMKEAVRLASELNPDLILLTRFDCVINFPMNLEMLPLGNNVHAPNWADWQPLAIVDHYYVATPSALSKLVACYDTFDHTIFNDGSEYMRWVQANGRMRHGWTVSHSIVRWFLEKCKLNYVRYGLTDRDTCVTRQLSKFRFKL